MIDMPQVVPELKNISETSILLLDSWKLEAYLPGSQGVK
jgi:hypothetical protein